MKKVLLVLLCVLVLNSIYATDITLSKSTYYPGETLEAEIPNVFIDALKTEDVEVYLGNIAHSSTGSSGLVKSDNRYYFYTVLPTEAGDYSLKIKDVNHYEGSVQTTAVIEKSFKIESTNVSYLSFNPGIIYATRDFKLNIKAYNAYQDITVDFTPTNTHKTITNLGYGDDKNVYFSIASVKNTTKSSMSIGGYKIPVWIYPTITALENTSVITYNLEDVLEMSISEINATLLENTDYLFEVELKLLEDVSLKNIIFTSSADEIRVAPDSIDELNKTTNVTIIINTGRYLDEEIELEYNNQSIIIPIRATITQNKSDVDYSTPVSNKETCKDWSGTICDSSSTCSGTIKYTLDASSGNCCVGTCKSQSSSGKWFWGLLLLIVLGAIGWYIYNKSNQGLGAEKIKNIFKKKEDDYEKRMNPNREVRRSLSKE